MVNTKEYPILLNLHCSLAYLLAMLKLQLVLNGLSYIQCTNDCPQLVNTAPIIFQYMYVVRIL